MEWTAAEIDRLYDLYERYVEQLRADVISTNRALGSLNPEKTRLDRLTRQQFESLVMDRSADPEATRLWLRRIMRGHESDFPDLQDTVLSRKVGLALNSSAPVSERRRATGA